MRYREIKKCSVCLKLKAIWIKGTQECKYCYEKRKGLRPTKEQHRVYMNRWYKRHRDKWNKYMRERKRNLI